MTGRVGAILPLVPIGIATFCIVITNVGFISFRLLLPYPTSPWEAGIVTDAWRMFHGQAVYAVGTDHATHMYGPLVTVMLAQAFRFTGPMLYVGRVAAAVSGIAVVAILARIFGRGDRLTFAVAAALLLAANTRTGNYFTETRPDLDSLLFAALALIMLYRGLEPAREKPRLALVLAGTALLVIAVLFKQTAAVFIFIPVLSIVGQVGKCPFRKEVLVAAIPIVGVLAVFGVIRQFVPGLWHFMVEVPAQYRVPALRAGRMLVELLTSFPLFFLAFVHWLFTDALDTWQSPRVRWLLAALICTIPASIVAFAKDGGSSNSLIPALVSVGAFCGWRGPVAFALLRDGARPLRLRIVAGVILGFMLFAHVYPVPGAISKAGLKGGHGVHERARVIAEARSLPGKVVCPDDPTIPLMAKGYAGRTAVFEADAVYWAPSRMQAVVKEINSADYVIIMKPGLLPDGNALVTTKLAWGDKENFLRASAFTKANFRTTSTPVYELWRRPPLPDQPSSPAR
jgi:4-amino-4-deoxy-L-arabinose transferase-like glycosyltransferase